MGLGQFLSWIGGVLWAPAPPPPSPWEKNPCVLLGFATVLVWLTYTMLHACAKYQLESQQHENDPMTKTREMDVNMPPNEPSSSIVVQRHHRLYHVNYSDRGYRQAQQRSSLTALETGKFDAAWSLTRADLDPQFVAQNANILNQERGAGYWLWKPYIIYSCLLKLDWGQYLFYADSGSEWIQSVEPYVHALEQSHKELMVFQLSQSGLTNAKYCSQYARQQMGCNSHCMEQRQILASFLLMQKTVHTLEFIKEWLQWAQHADVLTDVNNDAHSTHRHDQSILSLLVTRSGYVDQYKILICPDPSQYGESEHATRGLPRILNHHRNRD